MIKKKHYYRVYQENSKGKKVFQGYLYNKETKELKPKKENQLVMGKLGSDVWKNLYLTKKSSFLRADTLYKVKSSYQLGNGKKYYTIYVEKENQKDQFVGYINTKDTKGLQKIKKVSDYGMINKKTFAFTSLFAERRKQVLPKNTVVKIENIYDVGYRIAELYQENNFLGYVYLGDIDQAKIYITSDKEKKQYTIKDTYAYVDQYFKQKISIPKDTIVQVEKEYYFNDKKIYFAARDLESRWLGYIPEKDLEHKYSYTKEDVERLQQAYWHTETILDEIRYSEFEYTNEDDFDKLVSKARDLLYKVRDKEEIPKEEIDQCIYDIYNFKFIIDDTELRKDIDEFWSRVNNHYYTADNYREFKKTFTLPNRVFTTDDEDYIQSLMKKMESAYEYLIQTPTKEDWTKFKEAYEKVERLDPNEYLVKEYKEYYQAMKMRWESNTLPSKILLTAHDGYNELQRVTELLNITYEEIISGKYN